MAVWATLAEIRALPGPNGGVLSSVTKYQDAALLAAQQLAQDSIEHACCVSFTPVAFTETLDGNDRDELRLRTARPTVLTTVTVDGATVTGTLLYPDGRIYRLAGWPSTTRRNIVVTGTAGYATVPLRVKQASLLLIKRWLVDTHVSDRATTMTAQDGSAQYFVTAGVKGALTDVPEVNAVIADYGIRRGRMVA